MTVWMEKVSEKGATTFNPRQIPVAQVEFSPLFEGVVSKNNGALAPLVPNSLLSYSRLASDSSHFILTVLSAVGIIVSIAESK